MRTRCALLRLAHAHGLADEGHFEEATEGFLSVGELEQALDTARRRPLALASKFLPRRLIVRFMGRMARRQRTQLPVALTNS